MSSSNHADMAAAHWSLSNVMRAPHRLGFLLGLGVLLAASAWWGIVLIAMYGTGTALPYAVPSVVTHAMVMVFGFMPLLFSGFLFTAGPKWLNVRPPSAQDIAPMLSLQAVGWLLWMVAGHLSKTLALVGAVWAWIGLVWMYKLWFRLLGASRQSDRVHAKLVAVAGALGGLTLAAALWCVYADNAMAAINWILCGLWGFISLTFIAVIHRMVPFFTSNAVPLVDAWRPFWVLWLMVALAVFEACAVWVAAYADGNHVWLAFRAVVELVAGGLLLWLAVRWGMVQSLKIRLLAMLHIGFVWLSLSILLSAVVALLEWGGTNPTYQMGVLHAVTMGFLGSLIVAMVTRVSCGHSGRKLLADNLVWGTFWALQLATVLRIGAAFGFTPVLLLAALTVWLLALLPWALRLCGWYGVPRVDGKEG